MKRTISVILLFAFITVNFSKVIILVHYELNKTELTQEYCVNKDKPGMHCCAKCLLKKKLAEDEAKQQSPAMPDIKNDIQLFGSSSVLAIKYNKQDSYSINSPYTKSLHAGVNVSIYHPPCA